MQSPNAPASVGLVVRYLFIGALTFGAYFLLLDLLFSRLGAPYPLAVAIAYAVAVTFHFIANRRFTFQASTTASLRAHAARYIAVLVINYLSQLAIIYFLFEVAGFSFYLAAIAGIGMTLVIGFILLRYWVFAPSGAAS